MSAESYSLFYCLTRNGWLEPTEDEIAPEGWVRVCELAVHQGSPFGRESRNWKHCKTNPQWTQAEADLLEITYPRPSTARKELSTESLKALFR